MNDQNDLKLFSKKFDCESLRLYSFLLHGWIKEAPSAQDHAEIKS